MLQIAYEGKYADDPRMAGVIAAVERTAADAAPGLAEQLGIDAPQADWLRITVADALPWPPEVWRIVEDMPFHTTGPDEEGRIRITMQAEALVNGRYDPAAETRHELVHALMRRHLGDRHARVPRWFREGLALHLAGQGPERMEAISLRLRYILDPGALFDGIPEGSIEGDDYVEAWSRVACMEEDGALAGAIESVMGGGAVAGWPRDDGESREGAPPEAVGGPSSLREAVRLNEARDWDALRDEADSLVEEWGVRPESAPLAHYFRGKARLYLGETESAREILASVVESAPTGSWYIDDALILLARASDPTAAAALYERVLRDFPDNRAMAEAAYGYSFALDDAGDRDRAAEELDRTYRSFPGHARAAEARRRLAEIQP